MTVIYPSNTGIVASYRPGFFPTVASPGQTTPAQDQRDLEEIVKANRDTFRQYINNAAKALGNAPKFDGTLKFYKHDNKWFVLLFGFFMTAKAEIPIAKLYTVEKEYKAKVYSPDRFIEDNKDISYLEYIKQIARLTPLAAVSVKGDMSEPMEIY